MSGKERSVLRICFQFIKRLRENNIGTGAFQNGNARPIRSSDAVGKENIARDHQILLSLPLHVVNNASLAVSGSVDAFDCRFSKREHFASLQEHIRFRKGIHRIGDFKVMDLLIQVVPDVEVFVSEVYLHGAGELASIVVRRQNVVCMAMGEEERFDRSNSILLQVVADAVHTSGSVKNDGRFQNDIDQYECVR